MVIFYYLGDQVAVLEDSLASALSLKKSETMGYNDFAF